MHIGNGSVVMHTNILNVLIHIRGVGKIQTNVFNPFSDVCGLAVYVNDLRLTLVSIVMSRISVVCIPDLCFQIYILWHRWASLMKTNDMSK